MGKAKQNTVKKSDVKKKRASTGKLPGRSAGETMPAMIIRLLQQSSDEVVSFKELMRLGGLNRQTTGAVLSILVKRGIVARTGRGEYKLNYVPSPYGARADAVLRYVTEMPWSRVTEIQRGAQRSISSDTVRKALKRFCREGIMKSDGFFYALASEKRRAGEVRASRKN